MDLLTVHKGTYHYPRKTHKTPSAVEPTKHEILTVAQHAPDVICRFDSGYRLVYVNPAIEKATGIPPLKFHHKTTRELGMPEEHSSLWEYHIKHVFHTGKQTTLEFPFMTPKGLRHFQSLVVPEFDGRGRVATALSISRDITEFKELDKRKEEVVGFVSHELKTPVTSLKVFTQTLHRELLKSGDKHAVERLAKMDTQIDRLTNIIGDLMDTTRIDNDTLQINKSKFNFNSLVRQTAGEIKNITNLHKILIKGRITRQVAADRLRIGQVLTNLLTNAIRYTHHPSTITITLSQNQKYLTCSVQDEGIGIPRDQQHKIFRRFYRVTGQPQKFYMGMGLGLYISSEIIKKHHGQIRVKSAVNKGSTFSFTLPFE